jgi:hypothetical protein
MNVSHIPGNLSLLLSEKKKKNKKTNVQLNFAEVCGHINKTEQGYQEGHKQL